VKTVTFYGFMYLYSERNRNRLEQQRQIADLLAACKQGNQKAQLEIYNRYYKAMYNTALRILGNSDDAEDVMQEAFIKAFDKLNSFKGTATFGAWLKRIVINESIAFLRKKPHFVDLDESVTSLNIPETETISDTGQWQIKQVLEALAELKDNYRLILSLHFIEGYDYEEIMQILDVSYANVRTMMSRAKKKLKEKLTKKSVAVKY